MPDDQETTQNQDSETNSIPPSPQEPTEQGTINTAHSEPSVAPSEALESSPSDFPVKSNECTLSNSARRGFGGMRAGVSLKNKLVLKSNKKARVPQSDDAGLFFEGLDNKQPTSFS